MIVLDLKLYDTQDDSNARQFEGPGGSWVGKNPVGNFNLEETLESRLFSGTRQT